MANIRMIAAVTVMTAPDKAVAPGGVFFVKTDAEAARLVELGAATLPVTVEPAHEPAPPA